LTLSYHSYLFETLTAMLCLYPSSVEHWTYLYRGLRCHDDNENNIRDTKKEGTSAANEIHSQPKGQRL